MVKKILCLLFAVLIFASFAACGKNKESGSESNSGSETVIPEPTKKHDNKYNDDESLWTDTHRFEGKETNKYVVKNGTSEYKIVIPSSLSTFTKYAADELVGFFKEATGVTLPVLTDDGSAHSESGKYISLGDTDMFKTSGLSVDKTALGRDGARILTKDETIYIVGGEDNGVLYGVYDFLKMNFGYEVYAKDCYDLDTGVTELKLRDYNVTDIPDIPLRNRTGILQSTTQESDDVMFAYRMRTLDRLENIVFPIHEEMGNAGSKADNCHNSLYYLPKRIYQAEHPSFYSTAGDQLCYTARGDQDEYDLMVELCAEKVEWELKWNPPATAPSKNTVHIGIMDNWSECTCTECQKFAKAHNNSSAAAILKFVNDMAVKVIEWMNLPENAEYKREDLQFSFFAYQWTLQPPFTVNDDGSINIADDIKPSAGVKIKPFTAFSSLDYGVQVSDPSNAETLKQAETWSKFVQDGWSWTYGCFFNDYFCFYDPYTFYADYYKRLYENGYQFTYAQFHSNQRGADSGFYTLANYVTCKLTWNSNLEMNDLIDDYFEAMYGDAKDAMLDVFNECRDWFSICHTEFGWTWNANQKSPTQDKNLISQGFVTTLFDHLDRAYAAIDKYKKDTPTYEKLKAHIDVEWMFPAKVAITLYSDRMDVSEIKVKFKSLCGSLGITKVAESSNIENFINSF